MGKTTFMLNLCQKYVHTYGRKKIIHLLSLTDSDCFEKTRKINNPENSILLLDALDENKDAMQDCSAFLELLVKETAYFNKIVITCRTQFFTSADQEPSMAGIIQVGTAKKGVEIVKKYISPLSDEEVGKYLRKRFRFQRKLQKKAFDVVRSVPSIMARPLILSWIIDLCDQTKEYKYLYQIYDTIIEKWIERETITGNQHMLFEFSCLVAKDMYSKGRTTISAKRIEKIASTKGIMLEPVIARSRSLLNRNGMGEYRFAHRSFLEYFIACNVLRETSFPSDTTTLWEMSGARRFLLELLLSSVERTNPDQLADIDATISNSQEDTGNSSLAKLLSSPKLKFFHENIEGGFNLIVQLPIIDLDEYDGKGTLDTRAFFANNKGSVHCTVPGSGQDVDIVFEVRQGSDEPNTKLSMTTSKKNITFIS